MAESRRINNSGSVVFRHGLAQVENRPGMSYIIDCDFIDETKTEVAHAINTLAQFNKLAGNAFRWCISEELAAALDPA